MTHGERATYEPENGPSSDIKCVDVLVLDVSASRNVRNIGWYEATPFIVL